MIDLTSIENTIRTWIVGVTGVEVIFAHPNAPRPTVPYVVINIPEIVQGGTSERIYTELVDESVDIEHSTTNKLMVSINTYYTGAKRNATIIKDSLSRITVRDALWAGGLGYISAGTISDIHEVIDKLWEERSQFDCFFYVRSTDEENIETIKKVDITNEIDGYNVVIQ